MTIGGGGSDHSLFDDGRVAFGSFYQRSYRVRFCGPCEIAIDADECPDCGGATSQTAPAGWFEASFQRSFTEELESVVPHARSAALSTEIDDSFWE